MSGRILALWCIGLQLGIVMFNAIMTLFISIVVLCGTNSLLWNIPIFSMNCWLGHLDVKCVHTLKSIMSGMNFSEILCTASSSIRKTCNEGQQLGAALPNDRGLQANRLLDVAHSDVVAHMRDVAFIDASASSGSDFFLKKTSKWKKMRLL